MQESARRQQADRVEEALKQLEPIRNKCRTEQERERARVSMSEPEARIIKHGDNREWVLEERPARDPETLPLSRG